MDQKVKRKFILEYSYVLEDGERVINIELPNNPDYFPIYRPLSLESMHNFMLFEIACMEELEEDEIELEFREVSNVQ